MTSKKKQSNSNVWAWVIIIIGTLSFALSILLGQQYFALKAALIEESNPETIWHVFGNIFMYASIGSYLLAASLIAFGIGLLLVFFGIVLLRR